MLGAKANANFADKDGLTSLFVSAQQGHVETVRALIWGEADLNAKAASSGATALFIAAQEGFGMVCRALLKNGADVELGLNHDNGGALLMAAQNGHLEACRILVEEGKADVNKVWQCGTALTRAMGQNQNEVVAYLKGKGAKTEAEMKTE